LRKFARRLSSLYLSLTNSIKNFAGVWKASSSFTTNCRSRIE